jgi:flagellar assembly factor FliW
VLEYQITMRDGLIGIAGAHTFVLQRERADAPFALLTCTDAEASWWSAVVACDPFEWFPDYELDLSDDDVVALAVTDARQVLTLCLVSTDPDDPQNYYLCLTGPIVVNGETGAARQVVLSSESRSRAPLSVLSVGGA